MKNIKPGAHARHVELGNAQLRVRLDREEAEEDTDLEKEGCKKLSKNQKWKLARAAALERGDMVTVQSLDNTKDNRQAANRRKKMRAKARKQELNVYTEETYGY